MARVTSIFVAASIVGQLLFGLLIAALVCEGERRRLPGAALVRAIVLIGWVLPGVVIGIVWKLLLDESGAGILAYTTTFAGVRNPVFLSAPIPALVWVTLANIWRGTAFSMLVYQAALSEVPSDLVEAAQVDGAGPARRFWHVVLPVIRRTVVTNLMLITLQTLGVFGLIYVLTAGGPDNKTQTLPLLMYETAFKFGQIGYGTAIALVLLVLGAVFSLVYIRSLRAEV